MDGFGDMFNGGLAGLFGGMFGNSGSPYEDAWKQYSQYANKASGAQNPFYQAGTGAIPQYQKWLSGMQDPSKFINGLMGQYQESPFAKYQQQQGMRMANNMGSASGMTGSTPLMQQAQQNAQNISSGDMNTWLQNVLGVNNQYGAGEQNLMNMGQGAANSMSNIFSNMGANAGQMAYGKGAAQNNDFMSMLMGMMQMMGGM